MIVYSPWSEPTELSALVQKPNGGETFRSGSIRKIRWLSAVPESLGDSTIDIQISLNGESGPWDTIVSDIPNNGCYQWLVDAGGSDNCRIKVIVTTSKSSNYAISNTDFTIIGYNVDANGPYNASAGETIQFTGNAENGSPPYDYHWDFGNGYTSDVQNPTYSYEDFGNYTVVLSVKDNDDITIRDSTWTLISGNNSPSTPEINGPASGKPGQELTFVFNAMDPEDDNVRFIIDWGDTSSDITDFVASGSDKSVSHIWDVEDTYIIAAKAEDEFGFISPSATFTVTIPRNKAINNPILNFLQSQLLLFPLLQKLTQNLKQ